MDRSSRLKINKEMVVLNDTLDQLGLLDIYRTFYPKPAKYTFFSSAHRRLSRMDHMLDHDISVNKFKRIELISSIFSDHNSMKLVSNYRKKMGKE